MTILKPVLKTAYIATTLACSSLVFSSSSWSQSLSAAEQMIIEQVDNNFDQQLKFLEQTVNINSGTQNKAGVKQVGKAYKRAFDAIGMKTDWVKLPNKVNRADHLTAKLINGNKAKVKDILLIGHLDTVFSKNSDFQKFEREGNIIKGPGVTDMKDGNSIIVYALKALHQTKQLGQANYRVILNSDEESIGRPIKLSRLPMVAMAKKSDYSLSFESGWQNAASIARRGNTSWTLEVDAKRAHSSGVFSDKTGAGAIFEASRILNGFYSQIRGESGLTFNPGVIAGGTEVLTGDKPNSFDVYGKTNIVAQKASVRGDMRFISNQQREAVKEKMSQIVATNLPQASANISFRDGYPAMVASEGNKNLLDIFSKLSQDMGYGGVHAFPPEKRGAGDAAFVADHVDTIDGLGASGGGSHSTREYLDVESLRVATKRTAIFLYRLSQPNS